MRDYENSYEFLHASVSRAVVQENMSHCNVKARLTITIFFVKNGHVVMQLQPFLFLKKKQDKHKLDLNKDIFYNKHEFKSMYTCLRQVSGRGHRTQEPYGSALDLDLLYQSPSCYDS